MNSANIEALPTQKIRTSLSKIYSCAEEDVPHSVGNGLFFVQSCINHSCRPNAEVVGGLLDAEDARIKVTKSFIL
jgi:hypothetical protein